MNLYLKVLYTRRVSHTFNFYILDATKSQDVQNAFGVISECCSFLTLKSKIEETKPNA